MIDAADAPDLDDKDILGPEATDAMLETIGAAPRNGSAFTSNLCTVMADCGS